MPLLWGDWCSYLTVSASEIKTNLSHCRAQLTESHHQRLMPMQGGISADCLDKLRSASGGACSTCSMSCGTAWYLQLPCRSTITTCSFFSTQQAAQRVYLSQQQRSLKRPPESILFPVSFL